MQLARNDVLRCLLSCSSSSIYTPLDIVTATEDQFLSAITNFSNSLAPTLTFSLINVIFSYDPVGWGMPYNSQLFGDSNEPVVDTALHLLLIMLNQRFRIPDGAEDGASSSIVVQLIASMNRPETLSRLYDGFVRLLLNPMQANNTWMPYTMKEIRCQQELLILLWDIIDLNPAFVQFVLQQRNCCELVVPVVYFMVEARKDPALMGLLNVCTFILLRMSGDRDFGVQLNKEFNTKLPTDLPAFTGNHADLVIIAVHKLVVGGVDRGDTLIDTLLTVLCNISPYMGSISMLASMKLLGLFEIFSTPKLLLSRERANHFVFMLIEIFNNIIQYQYSGNAHLIYAILRRKAIFDRLASLALQPTSGAAMTVSLAAEDAANFTAMDTNGDGVVSREEFIAAKLKEAAEAEGAASEGASAEQSAAVVAPPAQQGEAGAFVATEEWLKGWKSKLPLECIQMLLQALGPKIEAICVEDPNVGETRLLEVINTSTMVGLLPVPHEILVRKYVQNKNMNKWFTAYIWGTIYMHNQVPPIFDSERILLFTIFYGKKSETTKPSQGSGFKEVGAPIEEGADQAVDEAAPASEPIAENAREANNK